MHTHNDLQSSTLARELELLKFSQKSTHTKVSEILTGNFSQFLKYHLTNELSLLVVNNSVEELIKILEEKNEEEQLDVLMLGVCSLYAFIKLNWTGPRELKTSDEESYLDEIHLEDKKVCEMLSVNSIEFSTIPRQPKLLLLARFLLSANYTKLSSTAWWHLRVLHIHQALLDENSSQLYDRIEALAGQVVESSLLLAHPELKLEFYLELTHVYLMYGVVSKSQQTMGEIQHMSDISLELKGALGKRTKWQQKNIAQLLLDISFNNTKSATKTSGEESPEETISATKTPGEESPEETKSTIDETKSAATDETKSATKIPGEESAEETKSAHIADTTKENSSQAAPTGNDSQPEQDSTSIISPNTTDSPSPCARKLPHNVALDDDTRLETISYEAADDSSVARLTGAQQAVVYTSLVQRHRCQPPDELRHEELRPYIDALVGQEALVWGVRYGTLYLRSKLEADHRRTVERSMLQLEELRASLSNAEPAAAGRMEGFFMSWTPSASAVESTLAQVLVSLGDIKSALLIYESLRHWEQMIACYHLLRLRHLAEKIVRQQLAAGETPKLYCLLGDATDEVEHYHTAWRLSGERSARAMKSLGLYYFKRKEYARAIPYFQKSLEVNSIQVDLWSRLGYAALQCEDQIDLACSAYNRYVSLEPDDFQGWNNLARAHLDRGHKQRAYHALVEAVRTSNMDNWKVIENLMRVALDVGHFECALRNYSHLLDIKPKHVDTQVLSILAGAILQDLQGARSLLSSALRLLGRLTSAVMNDSELWWIYAQLNAARQSDATELRRTLKFLTHAHAIRMRDERSSRDAQGRLRLSEICAGMSEAAQSLARLEPPPADKKQVLVTCKLALRSTLVTMQREREGEEVVRVSESLQRVESLLAE